MVKKAFVKTLEAFIAVILTFVFIVVVLQRFNPGEKRVENVYIMSVLEQNVAFRACAIDQNQTCVESNVAALLPAKFGFNVSISSDPDHVLEGLPKKQIYVDSVYIAGNNTQYRPQIVKLYYWTK